MTGLPSEPTDSERGVSGDAGGTGDLAFLSEVLSRLDRRKESFGRYDIRGEVARGGQGEILCVWDEDLRRTLAMKVILDGGPPAPKEQSPAADSRTLGRFLEEAQVTGQLDHPGIVPVHELGVAADGRMYFTMKLVKGRNLREIFDLVHERSGDWTLPRALGVMLKVCEAMAYAHSKGVIHRDLKPSNVMVGKFGEVYVMDWGLARVEGYEDTHDLRIRPTSETELVLTDRRDGAEQLITLDGAVVGTPYYMSPEQAMGHVALVGRRSDVYAVGAMLYHLLTGRMPYQVPGVRPPGHAVLTLVASGPPLPLRELAHETRPELEAICDKAMSRDPAERYANMGAMAEDLRAYLEGRVVPAYEAGALAELRKWVQRNRPLAAAIGVAAAVAVIGLGTVSYVRGRANELLAGQNLELRRREQRIFGLADSKRLAELVAEAEALWPAHPSIVPPLESWLGRARTLVARLPEHRAHLADVLAQEPATVDEVAGMEQEWLRETLTQLIDDLAALEDPDPRRGRIADVEQRLSFARSIRQRSVEDHRAAWDEALGLLSDPGASPAYGGLSLLPQIGLVPLGPDPDTGLWEFVHLQTGEIPERAPDSLLLRLTEESGVVLVLLPGGEFRMGAQSADPNASHFDALADEDEALHTVKLSPFFLSKYEMTQAQWVRFRGHNPSERRAGSRRVPTGLHPVEHVSWVDCQRVLSQLGLTLPTEAQWEYAARAGTTGIWWTGSEPQPVFEVENVLESSLDHYRLILPESGEHQISSSHDAQHLPVDALPASPFGLHNMLGNVWEWCLDGYEQYEDLPASDPLAPAGGNRRRVFRGGSFRAGVFSARCSQRNAEVPTFSFGALGVRPARRVER